MVLRIRSLLLLLCSATCLLAAPWRLTVDGKSNCQIKTSTPPNASETMAIKEMAHFTTGMAGTTFTGGDYTIRLAGMKDIPADMKKRLEQAPSPDAFYLKTVGKELIIAGKTPRAELYGVYTLFETYLGCRWLYPGTQGECLPKSPTITLPDTIDDLQFPSFKFRKMCWSHAIYGMRGWCDASLWMVRNKMDIACGGWGKSTYPEMDEAVNAYTGHGGHAIWYASIPYRKYFKSHPEYFSLWKGKRGDEAQRCLTHPDVKKLLADYVLKCIHGKKGRQVFSFGMSDEDAWCQCENCRKAGMYKGVFSQAQILHKLYSDVCNLVLAKDPQAELMVDFYVSGRTPPENPDIRYDSRVQGTYNAHQACAAHNLYDPNCKMNVKILKEMRGWRDRGAQVNFRGYFSVNNVYYAPLEMTLARDLKFMKKEGFDGWWEETPTPNCTFYSAYKPMADRFLTCWPYFYMATKLLWNVERDPQKLMDDAFTKYYGKAAAPMIKARNLKQDLWDNAPGHAYYNGPHRLGYCLAVPGAEKQFRKLFAEAEKLAGNDQRLLAKINMDKTHLRIHGIDKASILKKANSGKNEIPVRRRAETIAIDGKLEEGDWKKAETITQFKLIEDNLTPTEETRLKVLYDDQNFYVGIEALMEKAWRKPIAEHLERDSKVYLDDGLEIFLMPPNGIDTYWHWVINTAGAIYDAKNSGGMGDASFNSKGTIVVKMQKDRYVLEARLPIGDMELDRILPGQTWRMHVVRSCTNLQPPKTNEGLGIDGIAPHNFQRWWKMVPGIQILPNGTFGISATPSKQSKTVSNPFAAGWGGSKAVLNSNKTITINTYGHLGRYMQLPADAKRYQLHVEVRASGKGRFRIITRTNCGKDKYRKQRPGGGSKEQWYTLGKDMQTFHFTKEIAPYEEGYFFVISHTTTPVIIESATGAVEELPPQK